MARLRSGQEKNVECVAERGDASCTFIVQGRFRDGVVLRRSLDSLFRRQADGSIEQLIPVIAAWTPRFQAPLRSR